jgi:ferredoxin-NADP reductase
MEMLRGVGCTRPIVRGIGREKAWRAHACIVAGMIALLIGFGGSSGLASDDPPVAPADAHSAHHPAAAAPAADVAPGGDSTMAAPLAAGPPPPSAVMKDMMEMMRGMMAPSPPGNLPKPPSQPAAAADKTAPPASTPAPSAMGGAGGMSNGGMSAGAGCCGGSSKPFYATLMTMPSLTPEARAMIETEANRRLGSGSEQITSGQSRLHQAIASSDVAAVQNAAASVRQGLLLVESGASALQAVNQGQPPPKIALAWFKGQASVPMTDAAAMRDGPWGLSWFHLTTMTFFVVFLTAVLAIHFNRVRRVAGLVARLTGPDSTTSSSERSRPPSGDAPAGSRAAAALEPAKPSNQGVVKPVAAAATQWSGELKVVNIFQETPQVKTFRLMNPEYGAVPFTFLPGQFLTFSASIDGKRIRRSYTIASSPTQHGYVEITVKREEQGAESRFLHDNVSVGDLLEVSGPSGVFTFTGKETESIVLIAGGVGITPMMCIIRYLTDRGYRGDIFFLYGTRALQDFIFREEIGYLQKRNANLHVTVTMSSAEGTGWDGAKGPISREFIARSVPDIARRRVHLCGPPPMMAFVRAELVGLGVPKDRIKTEAFGPALGAAPASQPAPVPLSLQTELVIPAQTPAPAEAAAVPSAHARIEFGRSGKSGALAPNQSVLEAAEEIGVAIDYSCRVGICGTCMVPLTTGKVTMEVEDGLPPEQKAKGMILACQAKSVGNLVVDA